MLGSKFREEEVMLCRGFTLSVMRNHWKTGRQVEYFIEFKIFILQFQYEQLLPVSLEQ